MKRKFRLTRSIDFKRVRRGGKSYAHPLLVLVTAPGSPSCLRIGVSAGRGVGNAVKRNRAKRRIRASLQELMPRITFGWDLVVLARQPMAQANYHDIHLALERLLSKANILQQVENKNDCTGISERTPAQRPGF